MITVHSTDDLPGFEQDVRWTAVDKYTTTHLHPSSRANHDVLNKTLEHSRDEGLPDIATYPILSKMLALQCQFGNVTHFLEVGTLGGYTPIWVATTNPSVRVISVEVNPRHAAVARENIERAGVSDRVEVIVGPALEVLPKLKARVQSGELPPFGLTYIDADKVNNWNYFDFAVSMSRKGAAIYVDNVVRRGKLVSEEHGDEEGVTGARQLVEAVGKDARVDAIVQQTVAEKNYDGYLMAIVK